MIRALAILPLARLRGARVAWISVAAWSAVALCGAAWWHRSGAESPASHALTGPYATVCVPLCCSAICGGVVRGGSLLSAGRSLVSFGACSRSAALAHLAVSAVASAVVCALLGCLVATLANGAGDPSRLRDALTCCWVGALAGAAYSSLLCAGACFGRRGGGRTVVLVSTWLASAWMALPAAHLRSLLGGDLAGGVGQRGSALALGIICMASSAVVALRARR